MKIPKSHFSEYFKRSVVYLVKTELAVFIISIIEFVDLCTNVIDLTNQVFYFNKIYNYKNFQLSKIVLAISPYQYFFNFLTEVKNETGLTKNYLCIIVCAVIFIWFFAYFMMISNCDLDALPPFQIAIQKISINFFDFLLFRIIPIYSFDLFSREIMKVCSKDNYTPTDLIILFFALFILASSFS